MSSSPGFMDRMLKRAAPRPVEDFRPLPFALGEGLWALDRRLRHFGTGLLPSRTTIIRLENGKLIVVSAPALLDAETAAAIDALGSVEECISTIETRATGRRRNERRGPKRRSQAIFEA